MNPNSLQRNLRLGALALGGLLICLSPWNSAAQQETKTPPSSSGAQPALSEHLKPLEGAIGEWEAQWTDENGQLLKGKWIAKPDAGGTILVGRFEMGDETNPVYSEIYIYYWQPELKSVAYTWFNSVGDRAVITCVRMSDRMSVWQGNGHSAQGQLISRVEQNQALNDDTFVFQGTHILVDGEAKPGGPKMTFTRVKK